MRLEDKLDKYDPSQIEEKWYNYWESHDVFHDEPDPDKEPFSIVLPPPNVTGQLHMGHALDNTLQDILIRYKRMQGYNVLWLPGKDHAGIATQVKVEKQIAEEGLNKYDLGREKFLERVWAWKEKYGDRIGRQIRRLGSSCDWKRERFTMDEVCARAVREVFVSLYEKGLIYQGSRITNWCPRCQTALSDIEVEHVDEQGKLWYFKYPLADGSGYITIATTRPETIPGDTAIAVNPEDERYKNLIGKMAVLPVNGREIPIVGDEYVDTSYGTGCVKITPAHDPNDFEVGQRHNLPAPVIMNKDGTMNEKAGKYEGMDRYECRKAIIKDLTDQGLLVKIEDKEHAVGHCSRCHTTVEPLTSKQWFVKMKPLAEPAMEAVRSGKTRFVPERFTNIYLHWLENIHDWCISRQLWWGHRIPVWYCDDCGETSASRTDLTKCPHCGSTHIHQDPDVLDTWFSSALWPFSTMGWPDQTPVLKQWYPTSVMVTGYDIIFFWVARMMFMSMEFMHEVPFHTVFIHGLVRDSQGRKMSKSLGNGIDPLEVINKYGADALRFTLVTGNTPGNDMRFYYEKVEGNRNFANKIWNATKFTLMNLDDYDESFVPEEKDLTLADRWILDRLNRTIEGVTSNLDKFELGEAANQIYDFAWNNFCDWTVELAKPRLYGEHNRDRQVAQYVLVYTLNRMLALLHPFMPFVTEHLWQHLPHEGEILARSSWPETEPKYNFPTDEEQMERLMEAIKAVRNMRAAADVVPSRMCHIVIDAQREDLAAAVDAHRDYFEKLAHVEDIRILGKGESKPENASAAVVAGMEVYLELKGLIDVEKERARIHKEQAKIEKDMKRTEGKLGSQGFLSKAPAAVVEKERAKLADFKQKMESLEERLAFLAKL
jgi:valyl-tRNA synthetase